MLVDQSGIVAKPYALSSALFEIRLSDGVYQRLSACLLACVGFLYIAPAGNAVGLYSLNANNPFH